MKSSDQFAELLLPLPLSGTFTYRIPEELVPFVFPGGRVVVQFGKRKLYTALVVEIHDRVPQENLVKDILSALDPAPVVNPSQLQFWNWIASYYLCHEGEVMNAALPSAFKLSSESRIMLNPETNPDSLVMNEKEYLLVEALHHKTSLGISEVSSILNLQKVIPVINNLIEKGVILMDEQLHSHYKPRVEQFVDLSDHYLNEERKFEKLFKELEKRSKKQLELLMSYFVLSKFNQGNVIPVLKNELLKSVHASPSVLEGLVKKGVFRIHESVVSRFPKDSSTHSTDSIVLNKLQDNALQRIREVFLKKDVVLLHGVTSSGKTEIYIKYIREVIDQGKQVLYLLPEIALTSHLINRLRKYFGDIIGVYHSRFSENERYEIWNSVLNGKSSTREESVTYRIILGARSSIFLPFSNLGLVIVDEEHDSSFKQHDPAPRYNARDAAIYLAHLHKAKTILGSATPSMESYFNAQEGKYELVKITERYGNMEMPEIVVVDVKNEIRWKKMKSHFSSVLINQLNEAISLKQQVILFQNRRGFSPRLECEACNWMPTCKHCDVTLVYHKSSHQLRCHYCGYTSRVPEHCPVCKSNDIRMKGFGTEKVEEELKLLYPDAKIMRMDLDTMRSRQAYVKLLTDFEHRKVDILVGTQMVTKGLDFENVSTVSILNADNMLSFPDFRAGERSFQLMSQVSGRAGRKNNRGKVIIQTSNPKHPVILDVVSHNYESRFQKELIDRRKFSYPPYFRLIQVRVKHRDMTVLNSAAEYLASLFRKFSGRNVLGPEYPLVNRIKNLYQKQILIKVDRNASQFDVKKKIMKTTADFFSNKKFQSVKVIIDVDPQ